MTPPHYHQSLITYFDSCALFIMDLVKSVIHKIQIFDQTWLNVFCIKSFTEITWINSSTLGAVVVISEYLSQIKHICISYEIAVGWMPENTVGDKSTLNKRMDWCLQTASHYQIQCRPRSVLLYGVARLQWYQWCNLTLLIPKNDNCASINASMTALL